MASGNLQYQLLFIAAFFLCAILISSGAIGGEKIGFKFYKHPGAFAEGVKGVFKIFVFAALQYSTETVGLTAGESANPARDVPKAIRTVFYRIIVIFVGGIFFLTITVPYNDPNLLSAGSKTARSPFVIAFTRAGAGIGAHLVNAVILVIILVSKPSPSMTERYKEKLTRGCPPPLPASSPPSTAPCTSARARWSASRSSAMRPPSTAGRTRAVCPSPRSSRPTPRASWRC